MEDFRMALIAIANDPNFGKTVESYDKLAGAGLLAPLDNAPGDGGVGDLNAVLMRMKGLTWIAMTENAQKAYDILNA